MRTRLAVLLAIGASSAVAEPGSGMTNPGPCRQGGVCLLSRLTVSGTFSAGTLSLSGNLTVTGNLSVTGTLASGTHTVTGNVVPEADNTRDLGISTGPKRWRTLRLATSVLSPVVQDTGGTDRITIATSSGTTYMGTVANGATAVAHTMDNSATLSTAGAKLLSLKNNGTEKTSWDKDGAVTFSGVGAAPVLTIPANSYFCLDGATCARYFGWNSSAGAITTGAGFSVNGAITVTSHFTPLRSALPTCGSGFEGQLRSDFAGGASTGARTRLCVCTSDGAAVYAWQNLATAAVGTTTTCP